jgi:hypothetical protein
VDSRSRGSDQFVGRGGGSLEAVAIGPEQCSKQKNSHEVQAYVYGKPSSCPLPYRELGGSLEDIYVRLIDYSDG